MGPVTQENNLIVVQSRIAQHGLRILDVGGAGACFFRVVSHQLYGEHSCHMNVRYVGVQYMSNNPERFIESNTDHSWSRYLANMSQPGRWADALVIQAVANTLNLTIHIVESNPGFASVTNNSLVNSETDTAVINIEHGLNIGLNIGHVDETHYVSTVPFFEETLVNNVIQNNQPAQLTMDQCRTTKNDETIANMLTKEQKRKAYMKECMTRRRRNKGF